MPELNIHLRTESLALDASPKTNKNKNKLQTLLLHNLIKPPPQYTMFEEGTRQTKNNVLNQPCQTLLGYYFLVRR